MQYQLVSIIMLTQVVTMLHCVAHPSRCFVGASMRPVSRLSCTIDTTDTTDTINSPTSADITKTSNNRWLNAKYPVSMTPQSQSNSYQFEPKIGIMLASCTHHLTQPMSSVQLCHMNERIATDHR